MGKFSDLEGRNIPQFIPFNWADWEADPHTQDMNETMQGVYWLIIKELWKYDSFLFNYTKLAERIGASDRRNVRTFLEKWGHLFRCVRCDGVPPRAEGKYMSRMSHDHGTLLPCPYCDPAATLSRSCHDPATTLPCSCHAPAVYLEKVRNYKNTAISGSRLETNKTNVNERKLNQTNERGYVGRSNPSPPASTDSDRNIKAPARAESNPSLPLVPEPAPAKPELADIREWHEDRFGITGERLRNCILFQLDHAANDYFRKSVITAASMDREAFVTMLNDNTPPGWTRDNDTTKKKPVTKEPVKSKWQPKEEL